MSACNSEILALIRFAENFSCRTALLNGDARWIERAIIAEAKLASPARGEVVADKLRQKHPAIVAAEAHALFNGYMEAEVARLSEKVRLMDANAFDDAAQAEDLAWQERNAESAKRAIDREQDAWKLNQELTETGFGDLFSREIAA